MSAEEKELLRNSIEREPQIGRTFRDILYLVRYRVLALTIIIAIRFLGIPLPSSRIIIVLPAAALGLVLGLIKGYLQEVPLPPPIILIKPEGPSSARVFLVYSPEALAFPEDSGMPLGTPYGATLRLVDEIKFLPGDKLYIVPSALHRLALENPLEALAHIRSLSKLAEQLDELIARYTELYVSTRAQARQLARRRVSELLQFERAAERAAREELKKSLEGEKHGRGNQGSSGWETQGRKKYPNARIGPVRQAHGV